LTATDHLFEPRSDQGLSGSSGASEDDSGLALSLWLLYELGRPALKLVEFFVVSTGNRVQKGLYQVAGELAGRQRLGFRLDWETRNLAIGQARGFARQCGHVENPLVVGMSAAHAALIV